MTDGAAALDSAWIAANPLPIHRPGTTKNSRGRVLVVGGSAKVPGAVRLTGEAALRVGAGKLQLATIAPAALPLGLLVPEAGVIALPERDGEIAGDSALLAEAAGACDALVVGPGISDAEAGARLLEAVLLRPHDGLVLVVDAMAIGCLRDLRALLPPWRDRLVLTPHHGEMAALTGMEADAVADDPERVALAAARDHGAILALKGTDTFVAAPDGALLRYGGGGTGLATGGSGDVLAGAIAGLLARGADPLAATGWGVWLHGQAGRRVATTRGPIGFLARELPGEFPRLLPQ